MNGLSRCDFWRHLFCRWRAGRTLTALAQRVEPHHGRWERAGSSPAGSLNRQRGMHTKITRKRAWDKRMALRHTWFDAHGPCQLCGSSSALCLHHEDPKLKVDHNVWSWAPNRRKVELIKCAVLCVVCHIKLHATLNQRHGRSRYAQGCRCTICVEQFRACKRRWYVNRRRRLGYVYCGRTSSPAGAHNSCVSGAAPEPATLFGGVT